MASKATPKRLNTTARPSDQKAAKSASDDSSFTLVSYQKKHSATSHVTRASTKNEPNDREFQEATIGPFKKFQEKIFPILEQIFIPEKQEWYVMGHLDRAPSLWDIHLPTVLMRLVNAYSGQL
jgi:hypothetical protein